MSLIPLVLRCFFGTLAGLLRVAPIVVGQLFSRKQLPAFNPKENIELGAALLAKYDKDINEDDFQDVILTSKDGVKLHAVVDAGKRRVKGKRPIVFVHGFPELWISWIDQMKYFAAKGHPIIALTMRGYGLSENPGNGASLEPFHLYDHIVEDVRSAVHFATNQMGNHGADAPLLVAHDWGASVCWAYVKQSKTKRGKEVAGYASLTIPPPECLKANMGPKQFWASLYFIFFNMPWLPEKVMLANNGWMVGRTFLAATKRASFPSWKINTFRYNCLQPGALTAQLNYYRARIQQNPKPDPADVLGPKEDGNVLFDLPVLMIRGKDDGALTEEAFIGYDRFLSNARLVALDRCSHWIQADCPDDVNQELDKLLDRIARS